MTDQSTTETGMTPDAASERVDRGMAALSHEDWATALINFRSVDDALRFASEPSTRIQWARALGGLGMVQLMDAKALRAEMADVDEQSARDFRWELKKALAYFDRALAIQTDATHRTEVEGYKAYALVLLDRKDAAVDLIRRLIAGDGGRALERQVADIRRITIPEDAVVQGVLHDLWTEANP
tara:strand:+ start:115 stop:663 length:549 start_codon:yes stop_codon:yes gene_type:complete